MGNADTIPNDGGGIGGGGGAGGGAGDDDPAEAVMRRLIDAFGAMLDESLIRAIASDHDVLQEGAEDEIRRSLAPLAEMARAEEYTGFDPSGLGSGNLADLEGLRLEDEEEGEGKGAGGVNTNNNTLASGSGSGSGSGSSPPARSVKTEVTTSLSDASDCVDAVIPFTSQADIPEEEKVENLLLIFPIFKEHTVRFVLKESQGDLEHAFDALLSRQHLEESGELAKGVEGFYVSDDEAEFYRSGNRAKASSSSNKGGKQNKLHLSYNVVLPGVDDSELEGDNSINNNNKNNIKGPVLSSAATRRSAPRLQSPLSPSFPAAATRSSIRPASPVSSDSFVPILRVTTGSFSSSQSSSSSPAKTKDKESTKKTRSKPKAAEWQVVSAKKKAAATTTTTTGARDISSDTSSPVDDTGYANNARATAAALYRKGGSHPLYRQAAGVYAQRAREEFAAEHARFALAAERHVDQSSTAHRIDLHGVSVMDGVRIARDRVQRWWDALSEVEDRRSQAALRGFTVVTGVGYHSAHGVSRLRQAVGAALKNGGWRVTTLTGEFYVTGRG